MDTLVGAFNYFAQRPGKIAGLTLEHAYLIVLAMAIAVIIGVTVGILMTYYEPLARVMLYLAGIIMTIPSIALFVVLIPLFGTGFLPGLVGLILYVQLPILRNTYTGIKNIDPAILEAAKGMGMTGSGILWRIKLPLAYPVIMAGVRVAVVMGVGIGAIAAYIGAGGLGELIFHGISRANMKMVIIGAILVSILSILTDIGLGRIEKRFIS